MEDGWGPDYRDQFEHHPKGDRRGLGAMLHLGGTGGGMARAFSWSADLLFPSAGSICSSARVLCSSPRAVSRKGLKIISPALKTFFDTPQMKSNAAEIIHKADETFSPAEEIISKPAKAFSPADEIISKPAKTFSPAEEIISPAEEIIYSASE